MTREKTTQEKALDINMDLKWYGSFAEIGAGQEVARQFFQAGKASQTVALAISAYDMTFSDTIYGKEKSGRYVCEPRLEKMLDKEFEKLLERLSKVRGDQTCFFAFADTVATASHDPASSHNIKNSHGWVGIKFQNAPNAEPSQITLHVRLLDKQRLFQQETLGRFGVNLLHACFYKANNQTDFLKQLFEQIKVGSLSVDAVHTKGDAFKDYDQISLNLELLSLGWSDAIFITPEKQVINPSEAFWGKNIFIQRGFYQPVTNTHLDIANRGQKHFTQEFNLNSNESLMVFEFTLDNRLKNQKISVVDARKRVEMILTLGIPVMVSRFSLFYELKEFIRLSTQKPIGIVVGANHLSKLFDEKFYHDLSGGIMEGMGKLLDSNTRLYIYPHKTKDLCLLTKSFFPDPKIRHLYQHFIENKFIQDIAGCDEIAEFVHSDDILKMVKNKHKDWKSYVPKEIHNLLSDHFSDVVK